MNRDKAISKASKLLAMAADVGSPNEAAIAARQARAIMDEFQLSMTDLAVDDGFGRRTVGKGRKFISKWEQELAVAIAKFNSCICDFDFNYETEEKKLRFKGLSSDVQLCEYMFAYLTVHCTTLCSAFMKDRGFTRYNANVGTQFKNGYSSRIHSRILAIMKEDKEAATSGTDLMIVKYKLVEQEFGVAKYSKGRSTGAKSGTAVDARNAGKEAGAKASFHTGINAPVQHTAMGQ